MNFGKCFLLFAALFLASPGGAAAAGNDVFSIGLDAPALAAHPQVIALWDAIHYRDLPDSPGAMMRKRFKEKDFKPDDLLLFYSLRVRMKPAEVVEVLVTGERERLDRLEQQREKKDGGETDFKRIEVVRDGQTFELFRSEFSSGVFMFTWEGEGAFQVLFCGDSPTLNETPVPFPFEAGELRRELPAGELIRAEGGKEFFEHLPRTAAPLFRGVEGIGVVLKDRDGKLALESWFDCATPQQALMTKGRLDGLLVMARGKSATTRSVLDLLKSSVEGKRVRLDGELTEEAFRQFDREIRSACDEEFAHRRLRAVYRALETCAKKNGDYYPDSVEELFDGPDALRDRSLLTSGYAENPESGEVSFLYLGKRFSTARRARGPLSDYHDTPILLGHPGSGPDGKRLVLFADGSIRSIELPGSGCRDALNRLRGSRSFGSGGWGQILQNAQAIDRAGGFRKDAGK